MNVFDITSAKQDPSTGIYDLTLLTSQSRNDVILFEYTVQSGEEMRIDLVSESIYGSNEYIDVIMHINNIDNPLNIKEGSTLLYPSSENINLFRISETKKSSVQSTILNKNKTTRTDSNRQSYIEQGYSLSPVFLDTPSNPVQVQGNNITIGGQ